MEEKAITMYVGLDALLDTRLATLYRLDKTKIDQLLINGYHSRKIDEFEGYDAAAFSDLYEKRDARTILNATLTPVWRILLKFSLQTLSARVSTPLVAKPIIHINIHPYELKDDAVAAIVEGVRILTKSHSDIEVISMPLAELTPEHVKKTYVFMVMYDYWNWLEAHSNENGFQKYTCPEVTLIGPDIVRSKKVLTEMQGIDVVSVIEQYTSMFINLQLHSVSEFSVDLDRLVKNAKTNQ